MKRIIIIICFTLPLLFEVNGQVDTLQNVTISGVMNLIYEQRDSAIAVSLSDYLTQRARFEKDSSAVSWGHYGNYLYRKQPENLPYLDSLIHTTKGLGNNEEIFALFLNGNNSFSELENFAEALDFYIRARDLSLKIGNDNYLQETTEALASTKFLTGEIHESLNLYYYYNPSGIKDSLTQLFNIANCHFRLKNSDSLSYYSRIGIQKSLQLGDTINYNSFLRLNGVSHYMQGNFRRALDTLQKARALTIDSINLGSSYYYSALTHDAIGNQDSTKYYLNKIAVLNLKPKIYFPEIKNVWFRLYDIAKKENNSEMQLAYIGKFMEADSILESKSTGLISMMDKNYDLPLSLERKNQLLSERETKRNLTYLVVLLSVLIIFSIIYFLVSFLPQRNRLKRAIQNPEKYLKTMEEPFKSPKKRSDLPKELIRKLNQFFHEFELRKEFLDTNMSLQKLSTAAETNTSYLSGYLNTHHSGYSNYINNQRVQHAFHDMPKNPEIFKYTLEHTAKLYGFSSLRAFNRAFEKYLKIMPRDYLDRIKLQKEKRK